MATTKARVVLGKRPETIRRTVTAQLPEGGEALIEIDFKYRTRTAYGELLDLRLKEAMEADAAPAAIGVASLDDPAGHLVPPSAAQLQRRTRDATAAHILDIASGWGLPEPFDLGHVTQLCDEFPGMASAIVDDYRAAIIEGRRGN